MRHNLPTFVYVTAQRVKFAFRLTNFMVNKIMTTRSTIVGITRQSPSNPDDDSMGEGRSLSFAGDTPLTESSDAHILPQIETSADEAPYNEAWHDDVSSTHMQSWKTFVWPGILAVTLLAWTGFFGWAHRTESIEDLTSDRFINLLGSWSLPVSLIGVAWLLAMRSSRAEASRFADVAASLRTESEALELRMRTVNEEITLARGFLAENARELESIGRVSAHKLQEAAEQLGAALADSDAKAKTLEQVSSAATTNLEQLRKHLPVVTSAAKDVTNQIGNAGNSAQLQVKTLIAALQRVAEAGQTARGNIDGLEERAGEASVQLSHLISQNTAALETSIQTASDRTQQLSGILDAASSSLTDQLRVNLSTAQAGTKEISIVLEDAAQNVERQLFSSAADADVRMQELSVLLGQASQNMAHTLSVSAAETAAKTQEMSAMLNTAAKSAADQLDTAAQDAQSRSQNIADVLNIAVQNIAGQLENTGVHIDDVASRSVAQLTQQVEMLRESLADMKTYAQSEDARIDAMIARTAKHINEKSAQLSALDDMSAERTVKLAFSVEALVASTQNLNDNLGANHHSTDALIERSERLLLALDTAGREIDETLPAALSRADERLIASMLHLDSATQKAGRLNEHSDNMLAKLTTIEGLITTQREDIGTLMSSSDVDFAERQEQVDALATSLIETKAIMADITDQANNDLVQTLDRVRSSSHDAAEASRALLESGLSDVTERLSRQSRDALAIAIDGQVLALNDVVQQSFEKNIALSEAATRKIAAQLAEIDGMTLNLETRLDTAREGFSGIDDDSFARQMVTLTESLNSTAIDVAKILSNEVTDTSWAAYLKGDRGVFTRRAVRLLDTSEAKTIAAHYAEEPEFRDHVNRYIHDFEAMMRVLLSTRDGNAIGVTLLSSDVGKLYVALAQAIERLRN
jgi:hypothetical protein